MKKVMVVHPGKQHSYKTASALEKVGLLDEYVTSVYNKPMTITRLLCRLSGGGIKKKIKAHFSADIPVGKVRVIAQLRGNLALVILKIPVIKNYYSKWNNSLNDAFGKKVAKEAGRRNVNAIISYDYNSTELFEILKKENPHILKILDVSIATRPFMQITFRADYERTGDRALIEQYPEIWKEENLARARREIELADYFLAPSRVVKDSLIYCGASEDRIKIVPYGADCSRFTYSERVVKKGAPLNLIFVGIVNHRKGIHHLLSVCRKLGSKKVNVNLVGEYDSDGNIYQTYKNDDNIHFRGFIGHDTLSKMYQSADVFVFPTLGEGFGMVVIEAMSCGLPVIITNVAGGNDAITNGVDGFEIEVGNEDDLEDRIMWFYKNREQLPEMGKRAREKAEQYSWVRYEQNLADAVNEILSESMNKKDKQ